MHVIARNVLVWHRCPRPGTSSPTSRHFAKNEVEKRAITLIITGRFYPKSNLTIFYNNIPVYKIWIQYNSIQFNSNFIKIAKYILAHLIQNVYKHYNIPIHKSIFFPKKKYQGKHLSKVKKGHNSHNNGLILPQLELDLYFMIIYLCVKYEFNTLVFKRYQTETIFQHWKRAVTPKIIGGFYPKSNFTYIL